MGRDVADLEIPLPARLFEEEAQVIAAVEAAIDQIDPYPLPGQGLAYRLEIGKDRGLVLEEAALAVPHGFEHHQTGHGLRSLSGAGVGTGRDEPG
jgi:hypothetical protein